MDTIPTKQPTVSPGDRITVREAVAWVLLFTSLSVLVVWGIQAAMQKTAEVNPPEAKGQQTTFRPVLPATLEGGWAVQDTQDCRLTIALGEGSNGAQGTVTCRTGPLKDKGTFRVQGSRMTFNFGKEKPAYWAVRDHPLEFEYFLTNDDRLILIATSTSPGGLFSGQVYPFKRVQQPNVP